MNKTIEIAKCTLVDMYNIRRDEFEGKCRRAPVIDARRMLIYFLVDELGIKFHHVPEHLPALKSHATIMHHYYRMIELMDLEPKMRVDYNAFKVRMTTAGSFNLEKELVRLKDKRSYIDFNIRTLERLVHEA
jgi:chromosomal replication initiation ATPase DnaA